VNVRIKLLGTLPSHAAGSSSTSETTLDLPDNATVADLVDRLGIPPERIGIATIDGKLARAADAVPADAEVKFFQKIAGG
jgi:sulfur carrier protein ThiS